MSPLARFFVPRLTRGAQRIVEYERLLIGFGFWSEKDSDKFPRFMMIAEEAKGKVDTVADGVSGRVRKHLTSSTQEVTSHMDDRIDALEKKMGAMDSKRDAISAKLLEAVAGAQAPK